MVLQLRIVKGLCELWLAKIGLTFSHVEEMGEIVTRGVVK